MSFNEWRVSALGEIVELVIDYRGKTPKKLGGDWSDKGFRALSAKNIKTGKIVQEDSIRFVDENLYKKWMKDEICKGDILITSEAPFGEVYHWNTNEKIVLSQRLFGLRINKENYSKYVYYFMTSESFQGELYNRATGTTVIGLRQPELLKCIVTLPSLPEQISIAETLACLDEKIELNNRINKTLEEMAQAIFKQWFVDFDFPDENGQPYKSSGGEMEESELGLIPKRWKIGKLSDICDVLSGGTPKTSVQEYWDGNIPFFTPKDVDNDYYVLKTEKTITEDGLQKCNSKLYPRDTVFITARGTVGKVVLAGRDMAMNQSCYALKGKDELTQYFLFFQTLRSVEQLKKGASGAVFDAIVVKTFDTIKITIPSEEMVALFNKQICPLLSTILLNQQEIVALASIRDSLLPRLMSGEIRVPIEEV